MNQLTHNLRDNLLQLLNTISNKIQVEYFPKEEKVSQAAF